jgi:hypothetical protein
MTAEPRAGSFIRRLRHQLRNPGGRNRRRFLLWVFGLLVVATGSAIADIYLPNLFPFLDFTGVSGTYSHTGSVDLSGPFFQSLGTNGRSQRCFRIERG